MTPVATLGGLAVVGLVLWDAFETILLPRRASSSVRLAMFVLAGSWSVWSAVGRRIRSKSGRESYLGYYAMLSLRGLFGVWSAGLILGFALLHWGAGAHLAAAGTRVGFATVLYLSGSNFFTLGF